MTDEKFQKAIIKYKDIETVERHKIKVRWACGKFSKHHMRDIEGYDVFWVNTGDLVSKVEFGDMGGRKIEYKKLLNSSSISQRRISLAIYHWANKKYMDLPELCIASGKLCLGDGRHRTIVAYHLGELKIPVAIPTEQVRKIQNLINLDKN